MEETADHYNEMSANEPQIQTWDLSIHAEQKADINSNTMEPLILDLSCKKHVTSMLTEEIASSVSLATGDLASKRYQQPSLSDMARQSPIAGSVIPLSEPDLPRNTKYETTYDSQTNNNLPIYFSPSNVIMTPYEQLISVPQSTETIKIPMAPFPVSASSMPVPCADINYSEAFQNSSPTVLSLFTEAESSVPSSGAIKKTQRPFKVYSRNAVPMAINFDPNGDFEKFRQTMLAVRRNVTSSNPRMRRTSKNSSGSPTSTVVEKDAAYLEKRKKNNEAAKRSRDNRKAKEDDLAIRVFYLEKKIMQYENIIKQLRELLLKHGVAC